MCIEGLHFFHYLANYVDVCASISKTKHESSYVLTSLQYFKPRYHSYYSDYAGQSGVRVPAGTNDFFFLERPEPLWRPTSLLFSGYQLFVPWGKKAGAWCLPLTSI